MHAKAVLPTRPRGSTPQPPIRGEQAEGTATFPFRLPAAASMGEAKGEDDVEEAAGSMTVGTSRTARKRLAAVPAPGLRRGRRRCGTATRQRQGTAAAAGAGGESVKLSLCRPSLPLGCLPTHCRVRTRVQVAWVDGARVVGKFVLLPCYVHARTCTQASTRALTRSLTHTRTHEHALAWPLRTTPGKRQCSPLLTATQTTRSTTRRSLGGPSHSENCVTSMRHVMSK